MPRRKPKVRQSLERQLEKLSRRVLEPTGTDLPHQEELGRSVIRHLGGMEVFARKLAAIMLDESTPKDTLRRFWQDVTAILRYVEESKGGADDLSLADDEELKALARDLLKEEFDALRRDQSAGRADRWDVGGPPGPAGEDEAAEDYETHDRGSGI
jgi:hypothetical protein